MGRGGEAPKCMRRYTVIIRVSVEHERAQLVDLTTSQVSSYFTRNASWSAHSEVVVVVLSEELYCRISAAVSGDEIIREHKHETAK